MSKTYELKNGDDIREIQITLTSTQAPVSAKMILSDGDLRVEKTLTLTSGTWRYRFTDADFTQLAGATTKTYKLEVYATFTDGTNGTYPTVGTATLKVYPRL